jgi:hypothetical protein
MATAHLVIAGKGRTLKPLVKCTAYDHVYSIFNLNVGTNEFAGESAILSSTDNKYLQWYHQWLQTQLKNVPPSIINQGTSFSAIFAQIALSARRTASINDIAVASGLLKAQDEGDKRQLVLTLVFAVLGWQTMLYKPVFRSCPPQQLAIANTLDGYSETLRQDQSSAACCLPEFLLGFGLALLGRNRFISEDPEHRQAFNKNAIISPGGFNVARINIKWVDVIAHHLEFDQATNTLFLFRYPSFCMVNILSEGNTREVIQA